MKEKEKEKEKEKVRERKWIFWLCLGTFFLGMSFFFCDQKPEALTRDDFIRFHVIANSDGEEDQAMKLQVRDELLEWIGPSLSQMNSMEQTRAYLENHMEEIATLAEEVMAGQGIFYGAEARLGKQWIPEKAYGTITFPVGTYEAFTVTLGAGEGENWWCVMFPPLCLIDETEAAQSEGGTSDWIAQKYEPLIESQKTGKPLVLKFKTAELFGRFFGKIPEKEE